QPVGNGDYTLQVGPDPALKITINYQHAPRQTPLTDINGTPTAVSGPYRAIPDPAGVGPGKDFNCSSLTVNGTQMTQRNGIVQINRNAHGGKVHSDLAGYKWICGFSGGFNGTPLKPVVCTEP